MSVSGSPDRTRTHPDPDALPALAVWFEDAAVVGYLPLPDYPSLGVETVVLCITVSKGSAAAVAAGLDGPPFTDVYEVAGREDVIAIGRFHTGAALAATLAGLASDPRVGAVSVDVVLDAVCEYDTEGLLDPD